jgi:hypothetical protein
MTSHPGPSADSRVTVMLASLINRLHSLSTPFISRIPETIDHSFSMPFIVRYFLFDGMMNRSLIQRVAAARTGRGWRWQEVVEIPNSPIHARPVRNLSWSRSVPSFTQFKSQCNFRIYSGPKFHHDVRVRVHLSSDIMSL